MSEVGGHGVMKRIHHFQLPTERMYDMMQYRLYVTFWSCIDLRPGLKSGDIRKYTDIVGNSLHVDVHSLQLVTCLASSSTYLLGREEESERGEAAR